MASQALGAQAHNAAASWTILGTTPHPFRLDDDLYGFTFLNLGETSNTVYPKKYGFSIPAGATIVGVELRMIGLMPNGDMPAVTVGLYYGSAIGENKGSAEALNSFATVFGSPTDLWGTDEILTPEVVNNENFMVRLQWQNTTGVFAEIRLNYPELTIYYVEDTTPPVISDVHGSDTTDSLVVWFTDEPATSQVEYGLTEAYGMETELDEDLVETHSVFLDLDETETFYAFRVKSADAYDNLAVSGNYWLWRWRPGDQWGVYVDDGGEPGPRLVGGEEPVMISNSLMPTTEAEEIAQNVRCIIMTPIRTCPLYRAFGVNMSFLDQPLLRARGMLIQEYIRAIEYWEPRVQVVSIDFSGAALDGEMNPTVRLRVISSGQGLEV